MDVPEDRPDTDPAILLESIVARVLERMPAEGEKAISDACAEVPELLKPVRERIRVLQRLGLADRPRIERIGPYRVLRVLGEGGMGQVLLAEQSEPVHRLVAIKSIRGGSGTREILARFDLERQALAVLEHPSIARVFEAGEDEEKRPYFVMEFVDGPTITKWADDAEYTIRERIELFLQVTSALQHAHARGVIHRDLKPGNILVRELDGYAVVKVIDFGLAKSLQPHVHKHSLRTEAGQLLGTPESMSPEQAAGDPNAVDARTDVYSLGVVLYELLTGRLPFSSETLRAVPIGELLRILREEEASPASRQFADWSGERQEAVSHDRGSTPSGVISSLRGDLDWILERALAKNPNDRYASVADLELDLRRHLDGHAVAAAPERLGYRASKFVRRRRKAVSVAGAIALLIVVGVIAVQSQYLQARDNLDRFDRLSDLDEAVALETEWKSELWPLSSRNHELLERWIERRSALLDRCSDLSSDISALRTASEDESESPENRDRNRRLLTALLELEPRIGRLRELADRPAERIDQIDRLERESILERTSDWTACLQRIESSGRYPSLGRDLETRLGPQFGLVPLGPDPISQLEEFALLTAPGARIPMRELDGRLGTPGDDWEPILILVPRTADWMGAQSGDASEPMYDPKARPDESPTTKFALPAFFIGKHEITQAQWFRVFGENPSVNSTRDSREDVPGDHPGTHPVETISWVRARRFAQHFGCELPTEAQWERAARAGSLTPYWWGSEGVARIHEFANAGDRSLFEKDPDFYPEFAEASNDGYEIHSPIGAFPANDWGLHDTAGNVWEWCLDGNQPLGDSDSRADMPSSYEHRNPPIREDGLRVRPEEDPSQRMVRGGSFKSGPLRARSSMRLMGAANAARSAFGMRLARSIEFRSR